MSQDSDYVPSSGDEVDEHDILNWDAGNAGESQRTDGGGGEEAGGGGDGGGEAGGAALAATGGRPLSLSERARQRVPTAREITSNLRRVMTDNYDIAVQHDLPDHERRRSRDRGGFIDFNVPRIGPLAEAMTGVEEIYVHIYRNASEGSGIRVVYGRGRYRWRLEYNVGRGIGRFGIRRVADQTWIAGGPHSNRHQWGGPGDAPLQVVVNSIQTFLGTPAGQHGPRALRLLSQAHLATLLQMMVDIIQIVQSRRMYGGKKKTHKRRRRKRRKSKRRKGGRKRKTRRRKRRRHTRKRRRR